MEKDAGIEAYITKTKRCGGKIKSIADDFYVEEISIFPPPAKGKFVIVRVKSKNWETNRLIEKIASILKISPRAIGYAGIKDRRSISVQLMSIASSPEKIMSIHLPDVEISVLYRTNKPIYAGNLKGNIFRIVIRDIENEEDAEKCMQTIKENGFPNFFGIQRFGIARPITHTVGKYLLENKIKEAVMEYIAHAFEREDEESYEARKFFKETMDFEEALKIFPEKLSFERRMLEHLSKNPDDWYGALSKLPFSLRRMFIHAYQSFLFNRILSERIRRGMPINEAVEGDIVTRKMQEERGVYVNNHNIERINKNIKKGICFPTAPIIGYDSQFAKGEMGEIERKILNESGISTEQFKMPYIPELASAGMRRSVIAKAEGLRWRMEGKNIVLEFYLPKGCYATSLLREIMKADIFSY
ncbi:MAG: tRNA pseudouridine(13) synthase TruD [Thermoplasmata archaeon]|nr:tRNA pseudouridine(13) synthase TruD [Thermoplasmata archaeon]